MRSQLTRRIFRQLIHNELFPNSRPALRCCCRTQIPRQRISPATTPRRSLFGFSRTAPKEPKSTASTPGLDTLIKLNSQLAIGDRPPSVDDVLQAFNAFFQHQHGRRLPVHDYQAEAALGAFDYLQKSTNEVEGLRLTLADEDLRVALNVLSITRKVENVEALNKLGTLLFEELERRRRLTLDTDDPDVSASTSESSTLAKNLNAYIKVLAGSGQPIEARALLSKHSESGLAHSWNDVWIRIILNLLHQDKEDEVIQTIAMMKSFGLPFDSHAHQTITRHYATKEDLESTKRWYNSVIDEGIPTRHTNVAVLDLCIRKQEYEWGDSVLRNLLEKGDPYAKSWNLILRWSAAKGKGVDEIDRMMNVMIRKNGNLPEDRKTEPDMSMINDLIELAMSRDDPYTAERFVGLGYKWRLEPDARTHRLQLDYRLRVGDLDGARAAYTKLQGEDISDNQDVPFVNKLVVALCEKRESYNTIMSIVEDLFERKASFEPPTVAALTQLHLQRGEFDQAKTLVSSFTQNYSPSDYETIRDVFVNFILDRQNPDMHAWEAYTIFSPKFRAPVPIRTLIMTNFFSRGRIDMATHVFGNMRQQQSRASRPTADTYREYFQGLARSGGDMENLKLVHNMLKVDTQIEPDVRLNNSLMLAYTACGEAGRALSFWDDIAHSREGPTYSSIQIALRACEQAPFGERQARDIWSRLKRFDIQVTREIYASYIGALAGQGHFKECVGLVERAEADTGFKPDALMVGSLYNAAPGIPNKDQVEAWASKEYPEVWKELLALGKTTVIQGDALEDADMESDIENEDLVFGREGLFNIERDVEA